MREIDTNPTTILERVATFVSTAPAGLVSSRKVGLLLDLH